MGDITPKSTGCTDQKAPQTQKDCNGRRGRVWVTPRYRRARNGQQYNGDGGGGVVDWTNTPMDQDDHVELANGGVGNGTQPIGMDWFGPVCGNGTPMDDVVLDEERTTTTMRGEMDARMEVDQHGDKTNLDSWVSYKDRGKITHYLSNKDYLEDKIDNGKRLLAWHGGGRERKKRREARSPKT